MGCNQSKARESPAAESTQQQQVPPKQQVHEEVAATTNVAAPAVEAATASSQPVEEPTVVVAAAPSEEPSEARAQSVEATPALESQPMTQPPSRPMTAVPEFSLEPAAAVTMTPAKNIKVARKGVAAGVTSPKAPKAAKVVTIVEPKGKNSQKEGKNGKPQGRAQKLAASIKKSKNTRGGGVQMDLFMQQCAAFERLLTNAATFDAQISTR